MKMAFRLERMLWKKPPEPSYTPLDGVSISWTFCQNEGSFPNTIF